MKADDVTKTLKLASIRMRRPNVVVKPRLISDNGSSYITGDLAECLENQGMDHVPGRTIPPANPGEIERWHQYT